MIFIMDSPTLVDLSIFYYQIYTIGLNTSIILSSLQDHINIGLTSESHRLW
jgi:hypothetical protein